MENKMKFKKNDKVVMLLTKIDTVYIKEATIKTITSKGIIKTDNNYTFDINGKFKSQEKYNMTYGHIVHYNNQGKNILSGQVCINDIKKLLNKSLSSLNKMYEVIYKNKQCDLEKLESIKNNLAVIANEIYNITSLG